MKRGAGEATRERHPAVHRAAHRRGRIGPVQSGLEIPEHGNAELEIRGARVRLTNLDKPFWPELGLTKGDLLRYYACVAPVLLPHLRGRAMVLKRYPNGAAGEFFFMKRAPKPRPEWLDVCSIEHASGNVIDFAIVQDLASLLWVVNLGCIDLNQWYAPCDDVDRPDALHFDLDPTPGASFEDVRASALRLRDALEPLGMRPLAKTTGSRGIHVYVPIRRGPRQKEVWMVAKTIGHEIARAHPELLTAIYAVRKRPAHRVLVDYNQNAWGRTLASVYSVRPTASATVSTPLTWKEVEQGLAIQDFTIETVPGRIERTGDLWAPMLAGRGRFDLAKLGARGEDR